MATRTNARSQLAGIDTSNAASEARWTPCLRPAGSGARRRGRAGRLGSARAPLTAAAAAQFATFPNFPDYRSESTSGDEERCAADSGEGEGVLPRARSLLKCASAEELQDVLACLVLSECVYKKLEMDAGAVVQRISEYLYQFPPQLRPTLETVQLTLSDIPQHYLVATGGGAMYCAFMGTKRWEDIVTDAKLLHAPVWAESARLASDQQSIPAAHRGFLERARAIPVEQLHELAARRGLRLVLCGHSLGGAVAKLCTLRLLRELPDWPRPRVRCVAFATPAVGNAALAELVESAGWASHFTSYYLPEDQLVRLISFAQAPRNRASSSTGKPGAGSTGSGRPVEVGPSGSAPSVRAAAATPQGPSPAGALAAVPPPANPAVVGGEPLPQRAVSSLSVGGLPDRAFQTPGDSLSRHTSYASITSLDSSASDCGPAGASWSDIAQLGLSRSTSFSAATSSPPSSAGLAWGPDPAALAAALAAARGSGDASDCHEGRAVRGLGGGGGISMPAVTASALGGGVGSIGRRRFEVGTDTRDNESMDDERAGAAMEEILLGGSPAAEVLPEEGACPGQTALAVAAAAAGHLGAEAAAAAIVAAATAGRRSDLCAGRAGGSWGLRLALQRRRIMRHVRKVAAKARIPMPHAVSSFHAFGDQWFLTEDGALSPEELEHYQQQQRQQQQQQQQQRQRQQQQQQGGTAQPLASADQQKHAGVPEDNGGGFFSHHRMRAYRSRHLGVLLQKALGPAQSHAAANAVLDTFSAAQAGLSTDSDATPRVVTIGNVVPAVEVRRAVLRAPAHVSHSSSAHGPGASVEGVAAAPTATRRPSPPSPAVVGDSITLEVEVEGANLQYCRQVSMQLVRQKRGAPAVPYAQPQAGAAAAASAAAAANASANSSSGMPPPGTNTAATTTPALPAAGSVDVTFVPCEVVQVLCAAPSYPAASDVLEVPPLQPTASARLCASVLQHISGWGGLMGVGAGMGRWYTGQARTGAAGRYGWGRRAARAPDRNLKTGATDAKDSLAATTSVGLRRFGFGLQLPYTAATAPLSAAAAAVGAFRFHMRRGSVGNSQRCGEAASSGDEGEGEIQPKSSPAISSDACAVACPLVTGSLAAVTATSRALCDALARRPSANTRASESAPTPSKLLLRVTLPRAVAAGLLDGTLPSHTQLTLTARSDVQEVASVPVGVQRHRVAVVGTSAYAASLVQAALVAPAVVAAAAGPGEAAVDASQGANAWGWVPVPPPVSRALSAMLDTASAAMSGLARPAGQQAADVGMPAAAAAAAAAATGGKAVGGSGAAEPVAPLLHALSGGLSRLEPGASMTDLRPGCDSRNASAVKLGFQRRPRLRWLPLRAKDATRMPQHVMMQQSMAAALLGIAAAMATSAINVAAAAGTTVAVASAAGMALVSVVASTAGADGGALLGKAAMGAAAAAAAAAAATATALAVDADGAVSVIVAAAAAAAVAAAAAAAPSSVPSALLEEAAGERLRSAASSLSPPPHMSPSPSLRTLQTPLGAGHTSAGGSALTSHLVKVLSSEALEAPELTTPRPPEMQPRWLRRTPPPLTLPAGSPRMGVASASAVVNAASSAAGAGPGTSPVPPQPQPQARGQLRGGQPPRWVLRFMPQLRGAGATGGMGRPVGRGWVLWWRQGHKAGQVEPGNGGAGGSSSPRAAGVGPRVTQTPSQAASWLWGGRSNREASSQSPASIPAGATSDAASSAHPAPRPSNVGHLSHASKQPPERRRQLWGAAASFPAPGLTDPVEPNATAASSLTRVTAGARWFRAPWQAARAARQAGAREPLTAPVVRAAAAAAAASKSSLAPLAAQLGQLPWRLQLPAAPRSSGRAMLPLPPVISSQGVDYCNAMALDAYVAPTVVARNVPERRVVVGPGAVERSVVAVAGPAPRMSSGVGAKERAAPVAVGIVGAASGQQGQRRAASAPSAAPAAVPAAQLWPSVISAVADQPAGPISNTGSNDAAATCRSAGRPKLGVLAGQRVPAVSVAVPLPPSLVQLPTAVAEAVLVAAAAAAAGKGVDGGSGSSTMGSAPAVAVRRLSEELHRQGLQRQLHLLPAGWWRWLVGGVVGVLRRPAALVGGVLGHLPIGGWPLQALRRGDPAHPPAGNVPVPPSAIPPTLSAAGTAAPKAATKPAPLSALAAAPRTAPLETPGDAAPEWGAVVVVASTRDPLHVLRGRALAAMRARANIAACPVVPVLLACDAAPAARRSAALRALAVACGVEPSAVVTVRLGEWLLHQPAAAIPSLDMAAVWGAAAQCDGGDALRRAVLAAVAEAQAAAAASRPYHAAPWAACMGATRPRR